MPGGDISFVPPAFLREVLATDAPLEQRAAAFADLSRINALGMIMTAGSGHIGSSFSSIDLMTWVLVGELGEGVGERLSGRFFSSKGHDAPALYAVHIGLGNIDESGLTTLRKLDGLPGHPDTSIPEMITNTGPLGMGISKAKGFAMADRLAGTEQPTFVLLGDGELQEGQIWESLSGAVNRDLADITAIVDWNQIQSDTWVSQVSDLGDIVAKFAAFGWDVEECDGNDIAAIAASLGRLRASQNPGVLIAHTVKGKGVSFMEAFGPTDDLYAFHSGAPAWPVYADAVAELDTTAQAAVRALGLADIPYRLVRVDRDLPVGRTTLVGAWADALAGIATSHDELVVLDADLRKDLGLVEFARDHADRFIECGIAEQDMVSQAGALALSGRLPVVCSFACFLTTRPFEQILNNGSEGSRILYVGALAGVIPAGPGHSHQAVSDVATMSAVNGMLVAEPFHPAQVADVVSLMVDQHEGPSYLRLCSAPLPFDDLATPEPSRTVGVGSVLADGTDVVLVVASAPLVFQSLAAREQLAAQGISARVVATPWLNTVDDDWLASVATPGLPLVVVENHWPAGGLGSVISTALVRSGWTGTFAHVCVRGKQACGSNDEALAFHGLDAASIAKQAAALVAEHVPG